MENRSDLKRLYEETGASTMELAIVADLHPATIYRAFKGGKVSRSTLNRMRKGLSQLQEQLAPKTKSAG